MHNFDPLTATGKSSDSWDAPQSTIWCLSCKIPIICARNSFHWELSWLNTKEWNIWHQRKRYFSWPSRMESDSCFWKMWSSQVFVLMDLSLVSRFRDSREIALIRRFKECTSQREQLTGKGVREAQPGPSSGPEQKSQSSKHGQLSNC